MGPLNLGLTVSVSVMLLHALMPNDSFELDAIRSVNFGPTGFACSCDRDDRVLVSWTASLTCLEARWGRFFLMGHLGGEAELRFLKISSYAVRQLRMRSPHRASNSMDFVHHILRPNGGQILGDDADFGLLALPLPLYQVPLSFHTCLPTRIQIRPPLSVIPARALTMGIRRLVST